jgi:hypothetical protein
MDPWRSPSAQAGRVEELSMWLTSTRAHTAGRIAPYCYGARSRHTGKADDEAWVNNTAHDGIRSRILSMRRQRIYLIDNRHLYHGFLNCPPYDPPPQ